MESVHVIMQNAWNAYQEFSNLPISKRAAFMIAISKELLHQQDKLVKIAHAETNLSTHRLKGELKRTVYQLINYANAALTGDWLQVNIQEEQCKGGVKTPDIRKYNRAIGPVLVFGASNFPFAYSTVGGDTASAFSAGCSVIIKAHEAHIETSHAVAECVKSVMEEMEMPKHIFQHFIAKDRTEINELILHPQIKAIGFTGSFSGGKAIWELANSRKTPIPVFAEMSSINPVCILPKKLAEDVQNIASMLSKSMLQDAGQFCTNPGIFIIMDNDDAAVLLDTIGKAIENARPLKMLHSGIAHSFHENRRKILADERVMLISTTKYKYGALDVIPTIAAISAHDFLKDEKFSEEVFGSFTLVVKCKSMDEMIQICNLIPGQLTTTLFATDDEVMSNPELVQCMQEKCGRFILNDVPTGVRVSKAMHHGGPWPATTDSRFTSVGSDAIKRFVRPVCYQNWPNSLLPKDLQTKSY